MKTVNLTIPAQKRREKALARLENKESNKNTIAILKERLQMGRKEGTQGRRNLRKRKNVI